jgi:CelD/BcsL family acetyltransferase involved in cellulose biosynthesis
MWVVHDGVAAVLKLAHDEAHKALSPGTVLTARMVMHLLGTGEASTNEVSTGETSNGGVTTLDFGRGDDPYKRLWASARRQRIGVMLASPWHPAGAALIARHLAGRLRRSLPWGRGATAAPAG